MGAAAGFERPAADTFLDMSHAPLPIWIKYFIVNKLPTLKIFHLAAPCNPVNSRIFQVIFGLMVLQGKAF